jgi:hypothetical protein
MFKTTVVRFFILEDSGAGRVISNMISLPDEIRTNYTKAEMQVGGFYVYMVLYNKVFGKEFLDIYGDRGMPINYQVPYIIAYSYSMFEKDWIYEEKQLYKNLKQLREVVETSSNRMTLGIRKRMINDRIIKMSSYSTYFRYIMEQLSCAPFWDVMVNATDITAFEAAMINNMGIPMIQNA